MYRWIIRGIPGLLQADEKEGVYLAELDLDQLRAYRQREVHSNAYRRPKL